MGDITVRSIEEAELPDYLRCVMTAFFGDRTIDDEALPFWTERMGDLARRHAGFVGPQLAGTAGAFATELTVPGGATIALAAITGVTVLPTHRRQGLLREMMTAQLADCVDRGEVAAMLIAAEWPIYGRYGYGMATEATTTVLDARAARFSEPVERADRGTIELVDPADLRAMAPAVFDAHRRSVAGPIDRVDLTWDLTLGLRSRPRDPHPTGGRVGVVHRTAAGAVDGYALYRAREEWVDNRPDVKVEVDELLTAEPIAYRELWQFLASIDWVTKVVAHVRPVDEPLRFLLGDGRAAVQRDRSDHMWLRILDIRKALEARTYDVPFTLTVEVHDTQLGLGGRFVLDGGPDGATATPTAAGADIALQVDALSGAYLGGTPLWWFARQGKVEERTAGALRTLGAALRTEHAPWCTTNF
jgi:predicted acetyltransferase